jgi:hypothetical protein
MKKQTITMVLIMLLSTWGLFAAGQKEVTIQDESTNLTNIEEHSLYGAMAVENIDSFTLEEMLRYSIEDERMALAEYELIMKEFDISKPFSNIIEAEKTHEGLLLELYKTYNFEVPTFVGSEHVIIPETLKDTFDVGIEAEIKNIDMYEKFLSYDLNEDVKDVFIKLRDGSVSHLAAFRKQAEKY